MFYLKGVGISLPAWLSWTCASTAQQLAHLKLNIPPPTHAGIAGHADELMHLLDNPAITTILLGGACTPESIAAQHLHCQCSAARRACLCIGCCARPAVS